MSRTNLQYFYIGKTLNCCLTLAPDYNKRQHRHQRALREQFEIFKAGLHNVILRCFYVCDSSSMSLQLPILGTDAVSNFTWNLNLKMPPSYCALQKLQQLHLAKHSWCLSKLLSFLCSPEPKGYFLLAFQLCFKE